MSNLLDTHTFIWFINGDLNLSQKAREQIEINGDGNYISIASIWEMVIKISLNKLEIKFPFADLMHYIILNGFKILPITFGDTLTLSTLPFHHRDPFDRILLAQAINNNLQIISKDSIFSQYQAQIAW